MTSSSETSRLSGRPAWAFDRRIFLNGMRDGVPIALGYFAVSFSLGIAARNAGLTPLQGFFASLLNNASAGEYGGHGGVSPQRGAVPGAAAAPGH